jgi:SpoVK/Ycf46/Vps4 family AAA+-type ATPase
LTRQEAEGAFSLALIRHGALAPDTILELKAGLLRRQSALRLCRETADFSSLGGLDSLKAFCRRSLRTVSSESRVRPRGILLLGVPGTGKSQLCKALAHETSRPLLSLDVGALLGSLVGQTESNLRQALAIADAMAPCVLFIDEIERALSGGRSSGASDGGVTNRMMGTLLTWLNDHTSDVYVVATCNDVAGLPPEFSRAERFDGVFFLDLPSEPSRKQIWSICREQFGIGADQVAPNDDQWTGAEIRACCRLSALLDVPLVDAARQIVPIAVTASESVERIRSWADGRCLSAEQADLYRRDQQPASRRRSLPRPSAN